MEVQATKEVMTRRKIGCCQNGNEFPVALMNEGHGFSFSRATQRTRAREGFRVCVRTANLHAVAQGRLKDSVMSAVPPGLFVLRLPSQD
jgi:hypothetical protein